MQPKLTKLPCFTDHRGSLAVIKETERYSLKRSFSKAHVFRGLHLQLPDKRQQKKVWDEQGKIIDFCLDLNFDSPTFGKIETFELTQESGVLHVPFSHAHGFLTLEDTNVCYFCDGAYDENYELAIKPPKKELEKFINPNSILMSSKDDAAICLDEALSRFRELKW